MPRGDKTGPVGMGPMTGRGAGFCAGNATPGYMSAPGGYLGRGGWIGGHGLGFRGCGRGFRNVFYATGLPGWPRFGKTFSGADSANTNEAKMQILKSQAEYLSNALETINKRISEMEPKKDASE